MNISNPNRKWIPSHLTNVADTFKRFGWKPTTEEERKARQDKLHAEPTNITKLRNHGR